MHLNPEMNRKLGQHRGHLPFPGQECRYIVSVGLILETARSGDFAIPSEGHCKPPLQVILYFVFPRGLFWELYSSNQPSDLFLSLLVLASSPFLQSFEHFPDIWQIIRILFHVISAIEKNPIT